jgi:hypothetical protein
MVCFRKSDSCLGSILRSHVWFYALKLSRSSRAAWERRHQCRCSGAQWGIPGPLWAEPQVLCPFEGKVLLSEPRRNQNWRNLMKLFQLETLGLNMSPHSCLSWFWFAPLFSLDLQSGDKFVVKVRLAGIKGVRMIFDHIITKLPNHEVCRTPTS